MTMTLKQIVLSVAVMLVILATLMLLSRGAEAGCIRGWENLGINDPRWYENGQLREPCGTTVSDGKGQQYFGGETPRERRARLKKRHDEMYAGVRRERVIRNFERLYGPQKRKPWWHRSEVTSTEFSAQGCRRPWITDSRWDVRDTREICGHVVSDGKGQPYTDGRRDTRKKGAYAYRTSYRVWMYRNPWVVPHRKARKCGPGMMC